MKKKKLRHSNMGECVRFELYSVVERLQVGVKANERNAVKPVIVYRSKEEQRGDVNGCAVMYLDVTCLAMKESEGSLDFVGLGRKSGTVFVALNLKF